MTNYIATKVILKKKVFNLFAIIHSNCGFYLPGILKQLHD